MGLQRIEMKIVGAVPLIMNNARTADPFDPFAKEKKRLATGNDRKTDSGQLAIGRVEWAGALYHTEGQVEIGDGQVTWDPAIRVIMPGECVRACLIRGASFSRLGEKFKSGIIVPNDFELEYDGPKNINELQNDTRFLLRKCVGQGKGNAKVRVPRTRPIFRKWAVPIVIEYNDEVINGEQVWNALIQAGRSRGLGDWTPVHGRFEVDTAPAPTGKKARKG